MCRSTRPQQTDRIFSTFKTLETVEKYAYRATVDEVHENEYNLNIPRYVNTFEPEPEVDIPVVQEEIEDAVDINDLRNPPSMHFEKLQGYSNRFSVRVDLERRLEFEIDFTDTAKTTGSVRIVALSKHYK